MAKKAPTADRKSVGVDLDEFLKYESGLQKAQAISRLPASQNIQERGAYSTNVAKLVQEQFSYIPSDYFTDEVKAVVDEIVKDPKKILGKQARELDSLVSSFMAIDDQLSTDYFNDNKKVILEQIENSQLAKIALQIEYPKDEKDPKYKAITEYQGIASINRAHKEGKIPSDQIIGYSQKHTLDYITKEMDKAKTDKTNPKIAQAVKNALLLILMPENINEARAITEQIERQKKAEYEKLLPDESSRADYTRKAILAEKDVGKALQIAYLAATFKEEKAKDREEGEAEDEEEKKAA